MPRLTFSSSDGKDKDAKRKFGGGKMRAFPTGASVVGKMRAFGDGAARKKNDGPLRRETWKKKCECETNKTKRKN